ncbi:aminotransferase class V-fold PLP-dependent enzyme [Candidatus Puniceispirillum marinum]|uniref:Aminotransferase, class V n=1 Tax=Puniceispirillum marinum (strain IMCC1322) TaxID=488538 RepID=D5BQI3_PUNMI|nr:aminotransferase class V-fold PLP-dependent enzyme [Candidatus Puniceispirillum marinum]ADE40701.1 aminotransferase, class V [Candidatus Puniceispirillum marinum IMCC1322]
MPALLPDIDPDGLLEYSVVFTDRSLNSMSSKFQAVMRDISGALKRAYNAHSVIAIPGGGTYGMEAIARQFADDQHVMIIRNGWFSFRWSEILEKGKIAKSSTVLVAARQQDGDGDNRQTPFAPHAIDDVCAQIAREKPAVVFAPHVETSAGMILPDDYIRAVSDAVHAVGGLFVLDCVASGALWVDMQACGVDVLLSAPQKGWSASPCSGLVMLSQTAREKIEDTNAASYVCDLKKWLGIMETYENGGHAYHATMPTDALATFRDALLETEAYGFEKTRQEQIDLGAAIRSLLESRGFRSVAASGFQAPSVVVSFTDDDNLKNGSKFAACGVQIAAGVPLECGEGPDYKSFRIGLFGLDKLHNCERTVANFAAALDKIVS